MLGYELYLLGAETMKKKARASTQHGVHRAPVFELVVRAVRSRFRDRRGCRECFYRHRYSNSLKTFHPKPAQALPTIRKAWRIGWFQDVYFPKYDLASPKSTKECFMYSLSFKTWRVRKGYAENDHFHCTTLMELDSSRRGIREGEATWEDEGTGKPTA